MENTGFIPTDRELFPGTIRRIADGLLNLLYPDSCFVCGAAVTRLAECSVCRSCWEKTRLLALARPWCPSCGLPFQTLEPEECHLCGRCITAPASYSGARSYGYYSSEMRLLIHGLKFRDRRNLASLLGTLLVCAFLESWRQTEIDLVVPMPLHPARKRQRGYNQAELLAAAFARHTALPVSPRALCRTRPTAPQVGLTDSQRMQNVRGAFHCPRVERVSDLRILLIDDVMTTGATAESASQALLQAGAVRVWVLTVARAVPGIE